MNLSWAFLIFIISALYNEHPNHYQSPEENYKV